MKTSIGVGTAKSEPKGAPEKTSKQPKGSDMSFNEKGKKNISHHVRKIKNGYLQKTTWNDDKDRYQEEEIYHENDPFSQPDDMR